MQVVITSSLAWNKLCAVQYRLMSTIINGCLSNTCQWFYFCYLLDGKSHMEACSPRTPISGTLKSEWFYQLYKFVNYKLCLQEVYCDRNWGEKISLHLLDTFKWCAIASLACLRNQDISCCRWHHSMHLLHAFELYFLFKFQCNRLLYFLSINLFSCCDFEMHWPAIFVSIVLIPTPLCIPIAKDAQASVFSLSDTCFWALIIRFPI